MRAADALARAIVLATIAGSGADAFGADPPNLPLPDVTVTAPPITPPWKKWSPYIGNPRVEETKWPDIPCNNSRIASGAASACKAGPPLNPPAIGVSQGNPSIQVSNCRIAHDLVMTNDGNLKIEADVMVFDATYVSAIRYQHRGRFVEAGYGDLREDFPDMNQMTREGNNWRNFVEAGDLSGSVWFASQWHADLSILSVIRDGVLNALFLSYRGSPGVAFLPWQQPIEQSFVAPLWTLSIEFYGSMIVLGLCGFARRSRAWWWAVVLLGAIFTVRSAYICFFIGHLLATFRRAERPAPARKLLPVFSIALGVVLCVLAEVWQPQWLRSLCADPTYFLLPGPFAPVQQKTFGAILVLIGIIDLEVARRFLSSPWLVRCSKLSFPLYLIHWPILFGPAAALFLLLNGIVGIELARVGAIVVGIGLAFVCSIFFLPVDRRALELSRRLRKRMSDVRHEALGVTTAGANPIAAAE